MEKITLFILFFIPLIASGQKSTKGLFTDCDLYNYTIDDVIGNKKCGICCKLIRQRRINKNRYFIASTIIINNPMDSSYISYSDLLNIDFSHSDKLSSVQELEINQIIDSIRKNMNNLPILSSCILKNDRRNFIIVDKEDDLVTYSTIYISKVEKNLNNTLAIIYLTVNYGPLAEVGKLYIFKKESKEWIPILIKEIWIS